MKTNRLLKRVLCYLLIAAVAVSMSGCTSVNAKDLMAGIGVSAAAAPAESDPAGEATAADFTVRLLKECAAGQGNVLVSPISVMSVLAMIANGASGNTLSQLESLFGTDTEKLNGFFRHFAASVSSSEQIGFANSIWLNSAMDLDIRKEFLQINADNYGNDVYSADFTGDAARDINLWGKKHTRGMIPKMLDGTDGDEAMIIANALAFEAKWEEPYEKRDVLSDMTFTTESGEVRTGVDFLSSEEDRFIETDNALGFMKPYKGGRYAFAALLPNEGVTLDELISSLDGKELAALLSSPRNESVDVMIPKFESGYSAELSEVLKAMGCTDVFDPAAADLSGIGTANGETLYLRSVLHKTFISVDENGTKAAAITHAHLAANAYVPNQVFLDRPFIYMIVDCESGTPLFIGAMRDIEG